MARKDKIYTPRKPLKTALTAIFLAALVLIISTFIVFFSFKKYIVYTSDGVVLEVPWLQEAEDVEG